MPRLNHILLALLAPALLLARPAFALAPNDDFENAAELIISENGYGVGTFLSDPVTVDNGSVQPGEYLFAPNVTRTFWHHFTLTTPRQVGLSVEEVGGPIIEASHIGLAIFEDLASTPTAADSPLSSTAGAGDVQNWTCDGVTLEPGTYWVQAFATNAAAPDGAIQIQLNLSAPSPETQDHVEYAHDFGVVSTDDQCTYTHNIDWACKSMDAEGERFPGLGGPDSALYNQSVWFRLTTGDDVDGIALYHDNVIDWSCANDTLGFRVFEGVPDVNDLEAATLVSAFKALDCYHTVIECTLAPNTEYTIQVITHDAVDTVDPFRVTVRGTGASTGSTPDLGGQNNDFGLLIATPEGTETTLTDHFDCATRFSPATAVPPFQPDSVLDIGGYDYGMATWFAFETEAAVNVTLDLDIADCAGCASFYNEVPCRLFSLDGPLDDGAVSDSSALYLDLMLDDGEAYLTCLPAGQYAVQVLGRYQFDSYGGYACNNHFGKTVQLTLTVASTPDPDYGLAFAGDVDWIHGGDPLEEGTTHASDSAWISCAKTLLPAGTDTVLPNNAFVDRAIYRAFNIEAGADGLGGRLMVGSASDYETGAVGIQSMLFRGDADALALDQGLTGWPEAIEELLPIEGPENYSLGYQYRNKAYCVSPGTYTLVTYGDSLKVGGLSKPSFTFTRQNSLFSNPASPENLGDIITQGLSVTSQLDTFTCSNNPAVIDGLAPPNNREKLLYREFYLSQDAAVTVQTWVEGPNGYNYWERYRVFSGRVSEVGTEGLTLAPYHRTADDFTQGQFYSSYSIDFNTPDCGVLSEGWYTVVSYGEGPGYDNGFAWSSNWAADVGFVGLWEHITVMADTNILPGPFFSRPHLACDIDAVANGGDPLTWDNTDGTAAIPNAATPYTAELERFKPQTDSLHIQNTLPACDGALRVSYYRFSTDADYHVRITGVQNQYKQLFALDALTADSLLFATTEPLADCPNYANDIEVCALNAGTYTLVVYGMVEDSCDVEFIPQISLQPAPESRFDLFENAYDFGTIPGDGLEHWGAPGDVHPDFPSLAPSNDHFTCRTGWEPHDPDYTCTGYLDETPDASDTLSTGPQHVYFQSGPEDQYERRTLWYSFAVEGMGSGTVTIDNQTGHLPLMGLFRADAFEGLPSHESIVDLGADVYAPYLNDSLTFVTKNTANSYNYCVQYGYTDMSWTFIDNLCEEDTTLRRYFVVVDFRERGGTINGQVELSVTWNPIDAGYEDPQYDFIEQANWIGDGENAPPYTASPVEPGVLETGAWAPITCATVDDSDWLSWMDNPDEDKSLWYTFEMAEPGNLFIATEVEAGTGTSPGTYYRYLIQSLSDTATTVSTDGSTGLLELGGGSYGAPAGLTGEAAGYDWRRWCLGTGTYYYYIGRNDGVTDSSEVRPHVFLESIPGDFCSNAIGTSGSTVGTYSVSVEVQCQSFGTDFGEDGENEGCLAQLDLDNAQSAWFQFDYTGTDSVTVSFSLGQLPSGVNASEVRYRIFYGEDCSSMIASTYCQNNELTQECVTQENGHFFVQVVYPGDGTGTLGFNFEVEPSNNPDCAPFNPFLLDADFLHEPNCLGDSVFFINLSTSGATIEYAWDFGFAGPEGTSSEDNPVVAFPDSGTYDVSLLVSNPNTGDDTTYVSQVSVTASGAPIDLPDSLFACAGDIATVEAPLIPGALYDWSTGDVGLSVETGTDGFVVLDYTVFTSFGQCLFKDSTHVSFAEVTAEAGLDQGLCQGDSTVHGVTVPPDVTLITWTAPDASVVSTADTVLLTQPGWYVLQQEGAGCIRRDSLLVDVVDPTFDLGPDLQACLGETVDIAGPDAPGMVHLWTDGSAGTTATFSTTGVHGLTVDLLGCTHTDSVALEIIDLTFGLPATSSFCLGESTAFSAAGLPVHELAVWTAPDAATVASTDIDFDQAGAYTLTLSRAGCSETETIDVTEVDLTFDLGPNDTLCMGETVLLDPAVPAGVGFAWSTGATTPTLAVDATLDVELVIDSLGCTSTDSVRVFQQDLAFALTPDSTICLGDSLQVEPVTLPPFAVDFNWSDGATSAAVTVSTAGPHTLTITDASTGCSADATMDLSLHTVDPALTVPATLCLWDTAAIAVNGVDSLILQAAYPDAASTAPLAWEAHPDSTTTYQWVAHDWQCSVAGETTVEVVYAAVPAFPGFDTLYCFNEAAQPLPATPLTSGDFTWTATGGLLSDIDPADLQPGDHTLDYTYTDDANGCPDTASVTLTVADTLDVAFLSGFPELCLQGDPLPLPGFVDLPGGTFTTDYLGGAPSLATSAFEPQLVTPLLAAPEAFAVQYALENAEGCTSTIAQTITVHPHPVADFTVSDDCLYSAVDAVNTSTVAGSTLDSAAWTLDGLGTLNDPLPDDVFWAAPGTYGLSLTVTSSIGCSSTQSTTVTAHPVPVAAFDWTGHCTNEPVVFTESSTVSSGSVTSFNWAADGAPWTAVSQPDSMITTPGQHDIVLVVASDFGCLDTVAHTIPVDPAPVADFTADDVCDEESVAVLPSASVSSGAITSMTWSLDGDAPFAEFSGFDLLMAGPGDYALQQFVTSDMGCSDSLVQSITVHPLPAVAFDVDPDACLGSTFDLLSTSTVDAPQTLVNQSWLLSNGVAFTGTSSTQPADALGDITVSLVVTTNLGCSSALTVEDAIEVHPSPVAGFDLGVEVVPFTHAEFEVLNQSSPDAVEWLYIMGDGTVYDEEAPEHQYDDYGVFEVTQIATNAYGCSDQVTHPIEVLPDFLVYVPTAFTPDNDGVNDIWKPVIEGVREIIEYKLIIFDRWGEVLFETDNPDDGWIGNDKGGTHFVRDGVYSYRLVVRAERAQLREEFGSITIVR